MNTDQIALIQQKYKCRIIEENGEYLFCATDIGKILKMANINSSFAIIQHSKKILTKTIKGSQLLNYLTYDGVCYILTKSKKSVIIEVAKDFQINIKTITYSCIEAETTNIIKKTFNGEEILNQYNVNGYKLDLYFPKYNFWSNHPDLAVAYCRNITFNKSII